MWKKHADVKKIETVEEFLARGGKINTYEEGDSHKRKTRKTTQVTISPQEMLDKAVGTPKEYAVKKFLRSQGYDIL
jgi:hypothetical protein